MMNAVHVCSMKKPMLRTSSTTPTMMGGSSSPAHEGSMGNWRPKVVSPHFMVSTVVLPTTASPLCRGHAPSSNVMPATCGKSLSTTMKCSGQLKLPWLSVSRLVL